jgi:Tol biopolymer transport system component
VRRTILGTLLTLTATSAFVAAAASARFSVKLATVNSHGMPADSFSSTEGAQQLSADGNRFVFQSQGANLPGGDGSTYQVYVRNFKSAKTKLISRKPNGDPVDGGGYYPEISENGRFVTWTGVGTGLPNAGADEEVWLTDLKTGKTHMVSLTKNGKPADDDAYNAVPSANGQFVAFESRAANLPQGDGTNPHVYVRDLKHGKTILASRNSNGDPVNGEIYGQSISANGRLVALTSDDPSLAKRTTIDHAYVKNLKSGKLTALDRAPGGGLGDDSARNPSMAPNGRFVAFGSFAGNLPGGNGNDLRAYVFDLRTGKLKLAAKNASGDPVQASSPRLSGDGKLLVFESFDSTLPGNDGVIYQVYARRLDTGKIRLLSKAPNGDSGNADDYYPSVSRDGRFAAFEGYATNLGGNPTYTEGFRAGPLP